MMIRGPERRSLIKNQKVFKNKGTFQFVKQLAVKSFY